MTGAFAPPVALDDPFCLGPGGAVSWRAFLGDVGRVAAGIRDHDAICNLVESRHGFAVVLAAAMLNGQETILPPARAPEAVATAIADARNPLVVETLDAVAKGPAADPPEMLLNRLPAVLGEVIVFTSGSTGAPNRHRKSWTALAGGALLTDLVVREAGFDRRSCLIVGTTPSQHMYGLEAAMFSGLGFGYCLGDFKVFHPGDVEVMATHVSAGGHDTVVLVTSPPHLRFLEAAVAACPQIRCVISATAPMDTELAQRIEAGGCAVLEIYGSTETGSMAWRRTTASERWSLLPGFSALPGPQGWVAAAPHLPGPVTLSDDLEMDRNGRFRLLGRRGDMVSIAGKRQTLGALNTALAAMPGLRDAIYVREVQGGEDRLTILVTGDARTAAERDALVAAVRAHMLARVDPVFVPRRVRIVDEIPRSATGKVADSALRGLAGGA